METRDRERKRAGIEAAEAATREILRYRDHARGLLDANLLTNGFQLVDPRSVLTDLIAAHAALGAAIKVIGETDWPGEAG